MIDPQKLKSEIILAFKYFGETNESELSKKSNSTFVNLYNMMNRTKPERVSTDLGDYYGYVIDIISKFDSETNTAISVQMFVCKNDVCYILHTSKQTDDEVDGFVDYEQEENQVMLLEDIDPDLFL